MTRDDLHLDPDPLYVEPEPERPDRPGCVALLTLGLVIVAAAMLAALASGMPGGGPA